MTFDVTRSPRRRRRVSPSTWDAVERARPAREIPCGSRVANFVTPCRHRFWPWKGAPGHPATVRVKLYAVDAWNDMLEAGEGKGATATDVADLAQEAMQASVDALSARPLPPNDPESPGRKGR